jgi:hypothetical protein
VYTLVRRLSASKDQAQLRHHVSRMPLSPVVLSAHPDILRARSTSGVRSFAMTPAHAPLTPSIECTDCAKIYGRYSKSIKPDEVCAYRLTSVLPCARSCVRVVCGACRTGRLVPLFTTRAPRAKTAARNAGPARGALLLSYALVRRGRGGGARTLIGHDTQTRRARSAGRTCRADSRARTRTLTTMTMRLRTANCALGITRAGAMRSTTRCRLSFADSAWAAAGPDRVVMYGAAYAYHHGRWMKIYGGTY